ncbi:MAG TPA: hypothetical protein VEX36_10035 [Thermoleophilaceae bacterium]|nr:hypothetical protein [Thermoleophilaceae bacterium]
MTSACVSGHKFGYVAEMFVFFSNRLGCGGSILVSLIGTLVVLLLLGVVNLD